MSFAIPTATKVNSLDARDSLLSESGLNVTAAFLTDTFNVGNLTVNAGVRWDRYSAYLPEQEQLAGSNGPVNVQALKFAEEDLLTWNAFAPRLGMTYDFSGTGKSVLKANYGLFWHNPGVTLAADANPNQASKTETYQWNDLNGNRRYDGPAELGARTASALQGAVALDRDLKQPFTHEAGVFFEQQITEGFGTRIGYVYKTEDDLYGQWQPGRGASAFTVPFNFVDIGVDGVRGSADDRNLTLFGLPTAQAANFPTGQVVSNIPDRRSRFQTAEWS